MATNPRAVIGANHPPLTPYEAIKINIDDLFETAQGFLDGEPIADEATAAMVSKLIADAREARTAAEAQRKIEAKPFDEGKAEVQARWTPLTGEKKGRCALIADTAKKALTPWLSQLEAERQEAARLARVEADLKAAEAQAALRASTDLEAREHAEELLKEASKAEKLVARIDKASTTVANGARAIGLVDVWHADITDRKAALYHYIARDPQVFMDLLQTLANQDVRAGTRVIPGFNIYSEKVAR